MCSSFAVVVIGAGAAGIAASRELARHGLDHVVLEARERTGGRAWTWRASAAAEPIDLGCEWLHSADRNVLARLAPMLGRVLDRSEPPWRRRQAQCGFGDAEQDVFAREQDAFYARLESAATEVRRSGRDRAASELLDPDARYNALTDAISTYYNGAPLDRVSVLDFDRYTDTEVNWRVGGGYGAMIVGAGADCPVRLGCAVHAVDTRGVRLRLATSAGPIDADKIIVTVPTAVLASGAIRFPAALDAHMQAASHLPLGLADKVYFTLDDEDGFAPDMHLFGSALARDTGSYTLRPRGRALVEGYFGGDHARHLEGGGLPAFADAARHEIAAALGHDIGRRLTPLVATAWARDPFAMGSYSHALPGHADDRAILATPFEDRILFAGEATSRHFFSTAHGAFEEGTRAAAALIPADRAASAASRR